MSFNATIQLDRSGKNPTFFLSGSFEKEASESLRNSISELFPEQFEKIIIDCSMLEYMDSSTLGVLTYLHLHLQNRGRLLELCNLPESIQEITETSGLNRLIKIV